MKYIIINNAKRSTKSPIIKKKIRELIFYSYHFYIIYTLYIDKYKVNRL